MKAGVGPQMYIVAKTKAWAIETGSPGRAGITMGRNSLSSSSPPIISRAGIIGAQPEGVNQAIDPMARPQPTRTLMTQVVTNGPEAHRLR